MSQYLDQTVAIVQFVTGEISPWHLPSGLSGHSVRINLRKV